MTNPTPYGPDEAIELALTLRDDSGDCAGGPYCPRCRVAGAVSRLTTERSLPFNYGDDIIQALVYGLPDVRPWSQPGADDALRRAAIRCQKHWRLAICHTRCPICSSEIALMANRLVSLGACAGAVEWKSDTLAYGCLCGCMLDIKGVLTGGGSAPVAVVVGVTGPPVTMELQSRERSLT